MCTLSFRVELVSNVGSLLADGPVVAKVFFKIFID